MAWRLTVSYPSSDIFYGHERRDDLRCLAIPSPATGGSRGYRQVGPTRKGVACPQWTWPLEMLKGACRNWRCCIRSCTTTWRGGHLRNILCALWPANAAPSNGNRRPRGGGGQHAGDTAPSQ